MLQLIADIHIWL